mmetsp:Transcript_5187/g.8007  ORF Transcript_5187/g.8007 Transcript_5187/m.8007 type:complete len:137 (+) Transcript_5187:1930-2340(+)|eukprot:CAMPEP_0170501954 /NCGR_PEP_ID=MMETSP0208-20121228/39943_1 /TAXON_ID=197538 /ORGANISM="Strombidium inclinatum, Strain S3" /LENGTH=136 /DNA_ID=CAMNT_0010780759 /DNA_START=1927 /DNA_END=2337 /DNA_ORIENTATION=-
MDKDIEPRSSGMLQSQKQSDLHPILKEVSGSFARGTFPEKKQSPKKPSFLGGGVGSVGGGNFYSSGNKPHIKNPFLSKQSNLAGSMVGDSFGASIRKSAAMTSSSGGAPATLPAGLNPGMHSGLHGTTSGGGTLPD